MAELLLVEPNRPLAQNYTVALSAAGHHVRHCVKGQTAIELADKSMPDMIIVELQLAAHNGLEFLYELRSYVEWQKIPVIILSVVPPHAFAEARGLPLLNISRYLYKPQTKLHQLVSAVDDLLAATVPA